MTNNDLVNAIKEVMYAEEISDVAKAEEKVWKAADASRNAEYIKKYFREWQKDGESWMHFYTKNYPHMGIQSTQRAEGSHAGLKKAIEAASGLESVFSGRSDR